MDNTNNISQELLESVEKYINKTLSITELQEFEDKLKKDSEFKAQVDDIKTMLFGIEAQALKEKLEDFHQDIIPSSNKTAKIKFLNFKKIAVAAALIIAVGCFWFFNQNSSDRLYAKYFKPDPGLPTTMSNTKNFKFYDAMVNYKRGDYKLAIKKWESLQKTKPINDTLNYFIGVAYLANSNENKAINLLESVIATKESSFINEAYYYLGLAHLKAKHIELAKENFKLSSVKNSQILLSELTD